MQPQYCYNEIDSDYSTEILQQTITLGDETYFLNMWSFVGMAGYRNYFLFLLSDTAALDSLKICFLEEQSSEHPSEIPFIYRKIKTEEYDDWIYDSTLVAGKLPFEIYVLLAHEIGAFTLSEFNSADEWAASIKKKGNKLVLDFWASAAFSDTVKIRRTYEIKDHAALFKKERVLKRIKWEG
jgi:hypothetical protein